MAGAGYKSWVDGDILTASDVNTYLMQQAVMVFADASARTSAIAAPSEGMVTYLTGTDVIEYYDGAAWQPILDQDVIEAKGDLIVGTADDAVGRLAVGTNGYVLTADSAETTGVKWAAAAGGGKLLQVVQSVYSTQSTTTSASFVDTGLSATITPSAVSSKVLAIVSLSFGADEIGSVVYAQAHANLVRTSTQIYEPLPHIVYVPQAGNNLGLGVFGSYTYLDSPSTTSATTYKVQYKAPSGCQAKINNQDKDSSLTLIEIGA